MFSKLSLRVNLAIPVVIVSCAFVAIIMTEFFALNHQKHLGEQLAEEISPALASLNHGYHELYQIFSGAQSVVIAKSSSASIKKYKAAFTEKSKVVAEHLKEPQKLIELGLIPSKEQEYVDDIQIRLATWLKLYDEFFELNSGHELYYQQHKHEMADEFELMKEEIEHLEKIIEVAVVDIEHQVVNSVEQSKTTMQSMTLIAILVAAFLAWYISKQAIAPIRSLRLAMTEITEGDGDLTARVTISNKHETGKIAEAFNAFVAKMQGTITEVVVASDAVHSQMNEISTTTEALATGAKQQQQESDLVATAVHEMSATSQTVNSHAGEASNASQKAADEALNAKHLISDTIVSIQSLSQEITQASGVINTLEQDVTNISSILNVIRGIAEQTNLLALNAAIEAARAGEYGRGFAVVADEVRALASKTQSSTGEIQSMIEKLQSGANKAVTAMDSSLQNGKETVQQADIAGSSLDEIVDAITIINDMNLQIATAATEQNQVSEDVNVNVQHIADLSHEVVEMVSRNETTCVELNQQCDNLDKLVGQFKV